MAMTVGFDSTLSGLPTTLRGLDALSQGITGIGTGKGTASPSVTLTGQRVGKLQASLGQAVDQGLLRSVRTSLSTLGGLDTQQQFFSQIRDAVGQVGDGSSLADTATALGESFQSLATAAGDPAQQAATVQSALDVTGQFNTVTATLQSLRQQADDQISTATDQVNQSLATIHGLNQQIVRGTALGADTGDLAEQRDAAVNDLAGSVNIQYFQRADGSMSIFAGSKALLNGQPATLTHAAATASESWMTAAGGQFDQISLDSAPGTDISGAIAGGQVRALLDMRDTTIPNLQSQLDETAAQMKAAVNRVANRAVAPPVSAGTITGTRTFATQGTITPSRDATSTITGPQGPLTAAAAGIVTYSYSTASGQITISGGATGSLAALQAPGTSFTVAGASAGANNGTYTVSGYDAATNTLTVSRANPVQTFALAGGTDSAVTLFDSSGNQVATTTLTALMATDTRGQSDATDPQAAAQAAGGPWSIDSFSTHLQSWLRAQGGATAGATVGLNGSGAMQVSLGTKAALAFHDQQSAAPGAAAQDATVSFDADGDGTPDLTVPGVSNFFGFNDVFTTTRPGSVLDSAILPSKTRIPVTTPQRSLTLSDSGGTLGPAMTIPAGSTLKDIAALVNAGTRATQSAPQASASLGLASAATVTVRDSEATLASRTVGPGTVTLQDMAAGLTSATVTAQVVQNGSQSRLRLSDSRGVPLTVDVDGGSLTGSATTLGDQLGMAPAAPVQAAVVPDGPGYRLRIAHTDGSQLYAAGNQDAAGTSVLTDLGLGPAAAGTAGAIAVRPDLQANPSRLPRATAQWNPESGKFSLAGSDPSTPLQMGDAMTTKIAMTAAGQIAAGSYTVPEHAASSISVVGANAETSRNQQTYQSMLQDSLSYQYASSSGVNLDDEVDNMVNFQQAYSASARVVTSLDTMLQTLAEPIRLN